MEKTKWVATITQEKIVPNMNKTYVIKNDDGYIRICEDECRIEIVPDISKATFFDSENFAYEGMLKNKKAFYLNYDTFYRIECVVVVFGCVYQLLQHDQSRLSKC